MSNVEQDGADLTPPVSVLLLSRSQPGIFADFASSSWFCFGFCWGYFDVRNCYSAYFTVISRSYFNLEYLFTFTGVLGKFSSVLAKFKDFQKQKLGISFC